MLYNCPPPPLFLTSEFHLGVVPDWPIAIFDTILGQESFYEYLLKYVRVSLFETKPFIKNTEI